MGVIPRIDSRIHELIAYSLKLIAEKAKMNILQILPALEEGGVEKGTVDLARALTGRGHKAVVISGGGKLVTKLEEAGVKHYELPVGRKTPFAILNMIKQVAEIMKRENIHIVHARSRVPAIIAFFSAKFVREQSHSLPAYPMFITTAHGHYSRHIFSRVMSWGRVVIVASNPMAHYMMKDFGVPYASVRLVPRGVDIAKFTYLDPLERRNKEITIGMVARITPLKGHEDFIKAASFVWRKISNLRVLIIGSPSPGREKYKEDLELLTRRLGLNRVVEFLGHRDDIPQLLKGLDVFVSATTTPEAFGRSIVEAMASGVPVVATRVGGVVDIVEDGKNGLLCYPNDPRGMADYILQLAKSKQLASALAVQARKTVEEKFGLEQMTDGTIRIYEEIAKSINILVIKLSSIGDVVLAVPSLRAIRDRFPTAKITVLVGVNARPVLNNCPYIDEVIVYDPKGKDRGPFGLIRTARRLVRSHFDVTVDLQNNRPSHLLSFLSLAPKRYGYANGKWSFLLNNRARELKKPLGPVDHQGRVLALLGIKEVEKRLELWPDAADLEWADNFLKENWLAEGTTLVGINPASSSKWHTKRWSLENFVKLANELAARRNTRVLITGVEDEMGMAIAFKQRAKAKPIIAVGKTSIPQLAALIRRCSVFVTSDSATMHIAASVNTPFVALFGPTDPLRHLPPSNKFTVIKKNLRCSPCYKPRCINLRNTVCMKRIAVEEVLEAVNVLLS